MESKRLGKGEGWERLRQESGNGVRTEKAERVQPCCVPVIADYCFSIVDRYCFYIALID